MLAVSVKMGACVWIGIFATFALISQTQADGVVIKVYRDINLKGSPKAIYIEKPNGKNTGCTRIPERWANEISSLQLDRNCVVIYKGNSCNGDYKILDAKSNTFEARLVDNLITLEFNDQVRSVRLC